MKHNVYRSEYEAYPFLCDPATDRRCDFELFTDYIASQIGLLRATIENKEMREDLLKLCELVYHMNPTLRTKLTVTKEEKDWLVLKTENLRKEVGKRCQRFVLTQGSNSACQAHMLRVQGKSLVRFLYAYIEQGHEVEPMLIDLANLLSQYFFYLALKLNELDGVDEIEYISRNYK